MSIAWLGIDNYQFYKSLFDLIGELNSRSPTSETCALLIRSPCAVAVYVNVCTSRSLRTARKMLIADVCGMLSLIHAYGSITRLTVIYI